MKKSTRIFVLAISLALLVGAMVGFSVNAEESAPEIVSKNIKVDGNYSLMFAVDPATVAGDEVTVNVYAKAPAEGVEAVQTITKAATATQKIDLDGDGTAEYDAIVFETAGVSAKDIADVWYITATSAGVTSEAITYSVREYAFERLYKNGTIFATAEDEDLKKFYQRQFYLEILDVGSAAQQLLVNRPLINKGEAPEMLAEDYTYVSVVDGTFTFNGESASRGFVDKNAAIALNADNASTTTWKIFTFDKDGVSVSSVAIDAGETLTVTGNTVITPYTKGVTPGLYFEEIGDSVYKMDGLSYKDMQGGSNGTNVFSHSGFSASSNGVSISYYKFEDCGNPDFGSVLKFGKPVDAVAGCQGTFHFEIAEGSNNANCVVVEFDFMYNDETTHKFDNLKPNSAGELITSVFFTGFSSNTLSQYKAWGSLTKLTSFSWQSVDYDTVLDSDNRGGDAFRIESTTKSFDLLPETWYNICFEIYPSENAIVTYVNGVKAGAWKPSTYTLADISQFNLVSFMTDYRLLNFEIWMDNVYAGRIVKPYVAP